MTLGLLGFLLWRQFPLWWSNMKQEGTLLAHTVLPLASGTQHSLPDAKPAVLLFWATWCAPCHIEMERFRKAALGNELPAQRVFAVNMGEDRQTALAHWKKENYPFELVFDDSERLTKGFGVSVTPTVILVGSKGQIETVTSGVTIFGVSRAIRLFEK